MASIKNRPSHQPNVVFAAGPYCYTYAIPYQIGYLKSSLAEIGIPAKCFDLSIDFFERHGGLEESGDRQKMARRDIKKADLIDIANWDDRVNFENVILPMADKTLNEYADLLLESHPTAIGFSMFNSNRAFTVELARRIRKKSPTTWILMGGPDCTSNFNNSFDKVYEKILEEGIADIISIGEGDDTIKEIVQTILGDWDFSSVKGILYRKAGKIHHSGHRPEIKDLDAIPFPDYSDFELSKYNNPSFPLVFNRGCNFRCTFCGVKLLWGEAFRKRSARNIADEILYISSIATRAHASFNGAYINTSRRLMNELADILIEKWGDEPQLKWNCWGHFNKALDPETCKKLAQIGCYNIVFGFESGSPKVVKDMRKGYTHDIARDNIRAIKDAGIKVTLFTIVGYPTETEEDFQMTLDFIEENKEHIDAAYCMSTFLLSDQMISDPDKYSVMSGDINFRKWTSKDGENTFEIREERLKRFYNHLETHQVAHN